MTLPARIKIFYSKATIKLTKRVKAIPKIINRPSKALTERQINFLRRGLIFTPTPKPNTITVKSYIQEFTRKVHLMECF